MAEGNKLWYEQSMFDIQPDYHHGRESYDKDATYFDQISAAWQLEPIGQMFLDSSLPYGEQEHAFLDAPYNPPENIENRIEEEGLREYADAFYDVRNEKHFVYLKEKIAYNNQQRKIRDDGGIMPEIIAALGDPLTYVPIPFVKGISFLPRFAKGAGLSMAVTATAEPIRHGYDPTATIFESAMYVGGAGLLGGSMIAAFGKRGIKGVDDFNSTGGKSESEKAEDLMIAFHNTETNDMPATIYDPKSDVTYNVGDDGKYKLIVEKAKTSIDEIDNSKNAQYIIIKKKGEMHNGVVLEKDTVIIDEFSLRQKFIDGSYVNPKTQGAAKLTVKFNSYEDWLRFNIKKQKMIDDGNAPTGKDAAETENLINQEIIDDLNAEQIGRETAGMGGPEDRSWFAENVDRWLTTTGSLMNNKIKNPIVRNAIADLTQMMVGDGALVSRATKAGRTVGQSALIKATANHFKTVGGFNKRLNEAFQAYRKNLTITNEPIVGYNPGAIGIKAGDLVDSAIRKVGGRKGIPEEVKFSQFNEMITKALRDDEYLQQAHPEIQKLAKEVRGVYDLIGKEAEELGMFQSQKSVEKLRLKYVERVAIAKKALDEAKSSEHKELIKRRLDYAKKKVGNLEKLLADIDDGLEDVFNPLVNNYVNRVYDIDAILYDVANDGFKAAPGVKPIDLPKVVDGKTVGMVIGIPNRGRNATGFRAYGTIKEIDSKGTIKVDIDGKELTLTNKAYKLMDDPISSVYAKDLAFLSVPQPGTFRRLLYDHFKSDPRRYVTKKDGKTTVITSSTDVYNLNMRVNASIKKITRDSNNLDMDGDLDTSYENSAFLNKESAFQSRKLNISDKLLEPYLINDINYLIRMYSERMHKRIEMTRKFGEANAETKLWDAEIDLLRNTSVDELDEVKRIITDLGDNRDKVYNIFNTGDPSSFMKARLPAALRNWASTAMMGKVLFASIVDFARIPMVHGFANTFRYLNSKQPFAADKAEFNDQISQNAWLGDVYDVEMNQANLRHIGGNENKIGRGDSAFGRFFDKTVGNPLEAVQSPFYHVNLLSAWTHKMKSMTQHISTHRFLEDSQKVLDGTATQKDILRLNSYGISKQNARAIAKLPTYKTTNGMLYTKQDEWLATKNGQALGDLMRFASFQDVQNTIITPGLADKPNMMHGVIRVRNETLANAFDNDVMRFLGGFEKTEFGGKFNNGFLALPFQFYAWSFAANRKLMLSGLSGREMNVAMGAITMIMFGAMGDYLKNPQYYQHKTPQEKIYRAIEMSGVLGLIGDANFALEVVSEGMFETPLGVRPSIGTPGRFGEANVADATGEFIGAGPGMIADLIHSFGTDQGFDERAQTIRRLIPFNNLIWFNSLFKKIYNTGAETLR